MRNMNKKDIIKLKRYKREFKIMVVMNFILILILSILFWQSFSSGLYSSPKTYSVTNIGFHNLTVEQQAKAEEVINQLKPTYFRTANSIIFTSNISQSCENNPKYKNSRKELCKNPYLQGITSISKNDVIVEYTDDIYAMKQILCHELNHHFFRADDYTHRILDDDANYLPCFKTPLIFYEDDKMFVYYSNSTTLGETFKY